MLIHLATLSDSCHDLYVLPPSLSRSRPVQAVVPTLVLATVGSCPAWSSLIQALVPPVELATVRSCPAWSSLIQTVVPPVVLATVGHVLLGFVSFRL